MNFEEFINRIRRYFQVWRIVFEGETLKIYHFMEDIVLTFSKYEFEKLIAKINETTSENDLEIYNDNYYEVLLQSETYRFGIHEDHKDCYDKINKIKYIQGYISDILTFKILCSNNIKYLESEFNINGIYVGLKLGELMNYKEIPLLSFVSRIILCRSCSLIIESETKQSYTKFQSYMYAYIYTYMFNRQLSIFPIFEMTSLFPQRNFRENIEDFECPKKTYNIELISYYNEAIASTIMSHKYLSFYHIVEYYYEKIFLEDQIKKARELITDPSFSYKRNKDIAKLINLVQTKSYGKDVAINEKNALFLVIQKHISQENLKVKLIDRYGINFLENLKRKVEFSGGNIIIFSDTDEKQFIDSLTNRIYKTRNSIVHSKESFTDEKKNNKYRPIVDDDELFTEVKLIQVVAEIIINETANEI